MSNRLTRKFGVLSVAGLLAIGTYAFTATNTVEATVAGTGSEAITGFAITDVVYTLDITDPLYISDVDFNISPTNAGTVKINLETLPGTWYDCVNIAGAVNCGTATPAILVADAVLLTVVAVQ